MRIRHRKLFWPLLFVVGTTSAALVAVSAGAKLNIPSSLKAAAGTHAAPAQVPKLAPVVALASRAAKPPGIEIVTSTPNGFRPKEDPVTAAVKFDQSQQNPDAPRVDVIAILPTGFKPAQYTHPKGRFILAVLNRSGLEEVALELYREAGEKLHEVRVPRSKLDWSEDFDLHPGRYVLKEVNHPKWACEITVTPN